MKKMKFPAELDLPVDLDKVQLLASQAAIAQSQQASGLSCGSFSQHDQLQSSSRP